MIEWLKRYWPVLGLAALGGAAVGAVAIAARRRRVRGYGAASVEDVFRRKVEQLHKPIQARLQGRPEIFGPCCCGQDGTVTDGHRILSSPDIRCDRPCAPVVCRYVDSAARHAEGPVGTMEIKRQALQTLAQHGKHVEIDGKVFDAQRITSLARGLPGDQVKVAAYRETAEHQEASFIALAGHRWRGLVIGKEPPVSPAPVPVQLHALAPPPPRVMPTSAERIRRKFEAAAKDNASIARSGPGWETPCSCDGMLTGTLGGHAMFSVRSEDFPSIEGTTEGICPSACRLSRQTTGALTVHGQIVDFRKFKRFVGTKKTSIRVGNTNFNAKLVRQAIDGLDAKRVLVHDGGKNGLDIGAVDRSWHVRVMPWGVAAERKAEVTDLAGLAAGG